MPYIKRECEMPHRIEAHAPAEENPGRGKENE